MCMRMCPYVNVFVCVLCVREVCMYMCSVCEVCMYVCSVCEVCMYV